MNTEIGRLLVEAGLATRTPDGRLDYRPEAANAVVVIAGGNGSYFSTVRLSFDPERGKGTVYQTGVWVSLIVAGPQSTKRPLALRYAIWSMRRWMCSSFSGKSLGSMCARWWRDRMRSTPAHAILSDRPRVEEHPEEQLHSDRHQPPSPRDPHPSVRHPTQ
jgi:hypothetical protein